MSFEQTKKDRWEILHVTGLRSLHADGWIMESMYEACCDVVQCEIDGQQATMYLATQDDPQPNKAVTAILAQHTTRTIKGRRRVRAKGPAYINFGLADVTVFHDVADHLPPEESSEEQLNTLFGPRWVIVVRGLKQDLWYYNPRDEQGNVIQAPVESALRFG